MKNHSYLSKGKNSQTEKEIDKEMVFVPKKEICVEVFDEGALVLNLHNKELTELNPIEYWFWDQLDGEKNLEEIADSYSKKFGISRIEALSKLWNMCQQLWKNHSLLDLKKNKKGDIMSQTKHIQNPDVNLREEDEDGALLFNPDTDQVKLLSQTGHYIWKLCERERSVEEIINAFNKDFDDVPEAQVKTDVEEFLKQMVDSGFIGVMDESKK